MSPPVDVPSIGFNVQRTRGIPTWWLLRCHFASDVDTVVDAALASGEHATIA